MLLDLVSPWTAAVETNDDAGLATFRERHATLLELLRLAHTPHTSRLPLLSDVHRLLAIQRKAADPTFRQSLDLIQQRASQFGVDDAVKLVLLPMENAIEPVTAIPFPNKVVVFALNDQHEQQVLHTVALARALACLSRWCATDARDTWQRNSGRWDRWELARTVPLRQWLYVEGLGWHLAQSLHPELPLHQLFGVNAGAWRRLREQEQSARLQLLAEMDEAGLGLVLRWLLPNAATPTRGVDGAVLPPQMGAYLAWRMTAPRVARMGIGAALREPVIARAAQPPEAIP